MNRAFVSVHAGDVAARSDQHLYGELASKLQGAVDPTQRAAWEYQIKHLRTLAAALPNAHFFLEMLIPRMGRRADLVVLNEGVVFVVEYKVGARAYERHALEQAYGYGLDLKHFHEASHNRTIVPILVATESGNTSHSSLIWDTDNLAKPIPTSPAQLTELIEAISEQNAGSTLDANEWVSARYRPTPTIIEAAQALYAGHSVDEISRSEAGAENLTRTTNYISDVIEDSKLRRRKSICFVTGVPGSGKTLAGLNLATARQRAHSDEHAVFLSGNGPLVAVLREALALDAVERASLAGNRVSKVAELRSASAFVQNIHHFRDDALQQAAAPVEKVAIFDEAQRAWDLGQTTRFMRDKRGLSGFDMSEPEFLLTVMDRHSDWCTIVCLVGGGQEINTGEAGIGEWLKAVQEKFANWDVHTSDKLETDPMIALSNASRSDCLHLATSIRSFRAERLSDFIEHLIDGSYANARSTLSELADFPLFVTRSLDAARRWLRKKRRATERSGLVASSNALRLKPHGVFIKAGIEPTKWFLNESRDVRSSDALEDAASEFEVQGLELDWTCVCWDANFARSDDGWIARQFRGSRWVGVSDENRQRYIANSYRVLLTRARQGMVIFVPPGDALDTTRPPAIYDGIFEYLKETGIPELSGA